jgi:hypothetical protein
MTTASAASAASATPVPTIKLSSPADLVAATPYLLGFHPERSLVMVALSGPRVKLAVRCDLAPDAEDVVRELMEVVCRQDATELVALGYGPADQVEPALRAAGRAADNRDLPVKDLLRVDQGRWWSYVCDNDQCCPPEGTPYDDTASAVATSLVVEGLSALPNREEMVQQVAPLAGPARTAMIQATERAWARLATRLETVPDPEWEATVLADGTAAVTAAIERYAAGGRLDDDEVAWLTVLLQSIPVRDVAWSAITEEQPHLQLWHDVTRRAEPELVPAPGSLFAFATYRAGNGALARAALERVVGEDPAYSMARLLLHALQHGLPPSAFDGWPWRDSEGEAGAPRWSAAEAA